MVEVGIVFQFGIEAIAVLATGYFAVSMWDRRSAPTAGPLLAVAALLFVGALGHVLLIRSTPVERLLSELTAPVIDSPLWLGLMVVVVLLTGGVWFLFTLQYTGRGGRLIPMTAAGICGYWALLIVVSVLSDVSPDANVPAGRTLELVLFLGAYLMGVLMIVGSVLILTTSLRRNAVRVGEAVALGSGGVLIAFLPLFANTLTDPTAVPVVLSLASASFVLALRRYPTFEAPPVARIAGRDRLIAEMDAPFVVVDLDGRIRDTNAAAERYFDTHSDAVLGESLETLLPSALDPETVADAADPVHVGTSTGATLACTANRITDERDRSFGHLLVFRDVTDRLRRERRLSVLNQLLTGAVSDRMETVAERVAPIATADGDGESVAASPSAVGSTVRAETDRLLNLVAWTREIERSLATEPSDATAVSTTIRDAVETVTDGGDVDVTILNADGFGTVRIDRRLLETLFEMLLTDSLDWGAAAVRIEGDLTDEGTTMRIVGERRTTDGAGPSEDRLGVADDEERSGNEVLIETARQAIQHYGGQVTVEQTAGGARLTTVELPDVGDERQAGNSSRATTDSTAALPEGRAEVSER